MGPTRGPSAHAPAAGYPTHGQEHQNSPPNARLRNELRCRSTSFPPSLTRRARVHATGCRGSGAHADGAEMEPRSRVSLLCLEARAYLLAPRVPTERRRTPTPVRARRRVVARAPPEGVAERATVSEEIVGGRVRGHEQLLRLKVVPERTNSRRARSKPPEVLHTGRRHGVARDRRRADSAPWGRPGRLAEQLRIVTNDPGWWAELRIERRIRRQSCGSGRREARTPAPGAGRACALDPVTAGAGRRLSRRRQALPTAARTSAACPSLMSDVSASGDSAPSCHKSTKTGTDASGRGV